MQTNAEMSAMMTERFNVSGALLAKLFGRPEEEDDAFTAKAGKVRDIGVRIAMSNRVFFTALTLVASLATAVVYGVGGVLAIDGALTTGTLVALAGLLSRLYGPLTALSNVRVDVMTALVSFDRVFEVLDLPPMIVEKPDAKTIVRGPTTVELDKVGFRYPTASEVSLASLETVSSLETAANMPVLHDVTFRVEPGQMLALVGPSGAGKTTITSLVARLYDASEGSVRVGGHDVRDITLASLHDVVGVVTQDAHMFHETIRTNLAYARPDATENGARGRLPGRPDLGPRRGAARRVWTPSSGTVAIACPAARSSAWPSRACCSRHRPSSSWTRRRRISTASPRSPSRRLLRVRWRAARHSSSHTGCRRCGMRTPSSSSRTGASWSTDATRSCWPRNGLYADLYRTQFASQERVEPSLTA